MTYLIAMTLAFLVPMVPAFVLYRMLPSTSVVSGPFKGLTVQLSGAFGGYFLLILIAFAFLAAQPNAATDELWEVKGKIVVPDGQPIDMDQLKVRLVPTSLDLIGDGRFIVRVPARRDSSGTARFPTLVFEDPYHNTTSIDLNSEKPAQGQELTKLSMNQDKREIAVNEVVLSPKKKDSYKTTGPAPQETAPISVTPEVSHVRNYQPNN